MRNLLLVLATAFAITSNASLYSFVKELQGITVQVSDYSIRGQRYVLPEAGISAQDFVNKGIYPIKISITNKSNELVTVSTDSIGFIQQDYNVVRKKLDGLSARHICAILSCCISAGLTVANLNRRNTITSGIWLVISVISFWYVLSDKRLISDLLSNELSVLGIQETISIAPGSSVSKFILFDQETYNQLNTLNLILNKSGQLLVFQMPLD